MSGRDRQPDAETDSRLQEIHQVVAAHMRRRADGEPSDDSLIRARADLMPELGHALRKARLIEQARKVVDAEVDQSGHGNHPSPLGRGKSPRETCGICLLVANGSNRGLRFDFSGHGTFIVGRSRRAHFSLPKSDPLVSRFHFLIEYNPPLCRLLDLGSVHGTYVNRQKVEKADLENCDLIQAGRTAFRLKMLRRTANIEQAAELPLSVQVESQSKLPGESPLTEIGDYHITRELGRGGMGVVYLGHARSDQREVAIKTIAPAVAVTARDVEQFLREARILARLEHPHIVRFIDLGEADGVLFFVMEYVRGTDVARLVQSGGPLSPERTLRIGCQMLEALAFAHGEGFVHRDIKPSNILVANVDGREIAKLADFGLSRTYQESRLSGLTVSGNIGGTVPFMAPEQITRFRDAKPAVDQYSSAATLYYMLTGKTVHDFDNLSLDKQLLKILLNAPVPIQQRRPDISNDLAQVIDRGLQCAPKDRFQSIEQMRNILLRFCSAT